MESKEARYFLGNDADELLAQLHAERDAADKFGRLLFRLRRAGVNEFHALEILFYRLYVDLDSISALVARDAVSLERDCELKILACGEDTDATG